MKVPFFLTVSKTGSVKTTKSKPNLGWDEISIFVQLEVPDALFRKPHIEATIIVPESAAVPSMIEAETMDNIKNAIEAVSGLQVKLTMSEPEE